ncbi:MAG: sel1 repeat family protein [Verrucomicrobia bacterium]|nr:sel1 repeat family protein [Verrucomicrobiota bacterium]
MNASFSFTRPPRREKPWSPASLLPVALMLLTLGALALTSRPLSGQERKPAKVSATEAFQDMSSKAVDLKAEYEQGVFLEMTKNFDEAAVCYQKAAGLGYAPAQNNLGFFYQVGQGVRRNYDDAMRWYRQAAEQGYAAAQNNLGVCYRDALGTKRDFAQSVRWFRMAAEQGLAAGQNNLGIRYYKGEGVATNYTEAVKWYRQAATQGLADALVNLGIAYVDGRGVPQDRVMAYIYFNTAAAQGDKYAVQARDFLVKQMTKPQIEDGRRRTYAMISQNITEKGGLILP